VYSKKIKERKRAYCMNPDRYTPSSCHSRGSGNPESVQLFKNTGFPFPDQVEDRFHGNDKKRLGRVLKIY